MQFLRTEMITYLQVYGAGCLSELAFILEVLKVLRPPSVKRLVIFSLGPPLQSTGLCFLFTSGSAVLAHIPGILRALALGQSSNH